MMRRCARTRAVRVQPRNSWLSERREVLSLRRQEGRRRNVGLATARSAGSRTTARIKRTTQKPGRVSPFLGSNRPTGEPAQESPTRRRQGAPSAGSEKMPNRGRPLRGTTIAAAEAGEKSEGRIGATTPGNDRQSDPVEQRRPVSRRASGGNHGQRKDVAGRVTETNEGSGESETGTRNPDTLARAPGGRGPDEGGVPAHPQGCGGGRRRRDQGAIRSAAGGQPPAAAHADAGGAISPPTDKAGAYPEGSREDATDRDLDHRGQNRA